MEETKPLNIDIKIIDKLSFFLHSKARYKVAYGGRGAGKSYTIASILVMLSLQRKVKILCVRQFENSLKDSVISTLKDVIEDLKLESYFKITNNTMLTVTGSQFIFRGFDRNIQSIKSIQAVDIVWVEEADSVREQSFITLIPTIRKEGSEIWISFNPQNKDDAVYRRFVLNTPENCILQKVNWYDNPYFTDTLKQAMEEDKERDEHQYKHIWEGELQQYSDALIFKGKFEVKNFITHEEEERYGGLFFYGLDFGFKDPLACVRCYIYDKCLWIDYEAGGTEIEINDIPLLLDKKIPEIRKWRLIADSSAPGTISHLSKQGYRIIPAEKRKGQNGKGYIEAGIDYLRMFRKIIIHERCEEVIREFHKYKYKVDKNTNNVLPIIIDEHNHYIDAIRYALDNYINKTVTDFLKK